MRRARARGAAPELRARQRGDARRGRAGDVCAARAVLRVRPCGAADGEGVAGSRVVRDCDVNWGGLDVVVCHGGGEEGLLVKWTATWN